MFSPILDLRPQLKRVLPHLLLVICLGLLQIQFTRNKVSSLSLFNSSSSTSIKEVRESDDEAALTSNSSSMVIFTVADNITNAFPNNTILQNENISYLDITRHINLNVTIPRNLNIVLSGDSLTRYQYIDLAYFLSYGSWVQPDDEPNMVMAYKTFQSWQGVLNWTHHMLKPHEQKCDCFRPPGFNQEKGVENRYFYNKRFNNRVVYLTKNGDKEFKTSWNASDVWNSSHGEGMWANESEVNVIYRGGWENLVKDYVCKMDPKPEIFIFNSGLWSKFNLNNHLKNTTIQNTVVQSLKDCGIISVYKTTTQRQVAEYEHQLCNLTDLCYDVSWTRKIPRQHYIDQLHYRPPIYSMLNVQLFSTILTEVQKLMKERSTL